MITTKIKPRLEDLPMGERKEVWIALILSCLQGIAKRTKQNKKNKTKQKTKKQKCLIKFTAFCTGSICEDLYNVGWKTVSKSIFCNYSHLIPSMSLQMCKQTCIRLSDGIGCAINPIFYGTSPCYLR